MLRQRNASRQISSRLTERISAIATSVIAPTPRCANVTVENVTMIDTSTAQRKITMPNFSSPALQKALTGISQGR